MLWCGGSCGFLCRGAEPCRGAERQDEPSQESAHGSVPGRRSQDDTFINSPATHLAAMDKACRSYGTPGSTLLSKDIYLAFQASLKATWLPHWPPKRTLAGVVEEAKSAQYPNLMVTLPSGAPPAAPPPPSPPHTHRKAPLPLPVRVSEQSPQVSSIRCHSFWCASRKFWWVPGQLVSILSTCPHPGHTACFICMHARPLNNVPPACCRHPGRRERRHSILQGGWRMRPHRPRPLVLAARLALRSRNVPLSLE